ncbi:MAG: hypothetical protein RBU37_28290, partial [Myxococcota bacterium]|nr:hypothetical protein [Myxococcota bacterium]
FTERPSGNPALSLDGTLIADDSSGLDANEGERPPRRCAQVPGGTLKACRSGGLISFEASELQTPLLMSLSPSGEAMLSSMAQFVSADVDWIRGSDGRRRIHDLEALRTDATFRRFFSQTSYSPKPDPLQSWKLSVPMSYRLWVDTEPAGALVIKDVQGRRSELGLTPLRTQLAEGERTTLELHLDGYEAQRIDIESNADIEIQRVLIDELSASEAKWMQIDGPLPAQLVTRELSRHRAALLGCVSQFWWMPPAQLSLTLSVSASGKLESISWIEGPSEAFDSCLQEALAELSFPQLAAGSQVMYRLVTLGAVTP